MASAKPKRTIAESVALFGIGKLSRHLFLCAGPDCSDPEAGEATWTDDPATVPAALLSGHRAAENVLGRSIPIEALWGDAGRI